MIDKRLSCVASFVRVGAVLADIGTDHAYLPVQLVQEGKVPRAIAADIGEGPAASARQHIREAGLSDRIEVRVCDGLHGVAAGEVSDVVIAGMGGETIVHIVSEAPWLKQKDIRLVLQPMTKSTELRRWLFANGFAILEERIVLDGRHIYCTMAAEYDGGEAPTDPLAPYVGALTPTADNRPYFEQQRTYLTQRIRGLRCGEKNDEAEALSAILAQLETFMNGGEDQ
ncbi:MAG: SAM-dependent methyltransferase [Clostridia bacterium]|nr:SAM-dependent methyltransferase [Clostridia bacterium]